MAFSGQQAAAEKFVAYWSAQGGSERSQCHQFWDSLLGEVLGVTDLKRFIDYEKPVYFNDGTTKSLDAWIPSTKVLIEHKSRGIDLDAPQAHHRGQTPFQQAWNYDNNRPLSEKARWIVVCNFDEMRIHDMEADRPETAFQRIALADLPKECHRLQFLVQSADAIRAKELEVSVKAGRVVGKLYNAFLEQCGESAKDPEVLKNLNKLCVRLVFCVYAEDAGVFAKDQFLDFLRKFHFSSIHLQLGELFKVLRQKPEDRGPYVSEELKAFPYVGGLLFKEDVPIAPFSEKSAKILLKEASERFDWSEISPTIFGAVFESTLNPETRRKEGMHYTSEENIHKVIDPLFLDDLTAQFEKIRRVPNLKKRNAALEDYQKHLGSLTFLDPACGSGNFLTETYLSLRRLENKALELRFKGQGQFDLGDRKLIHVSINQFHGIEINDFAVAVAQTAMWIAECKMMEQTNRILSKNFTPLPLTDSAHIVEGNALRMDWTKDFPLFAKSGKSFVMGNPPFVGASMMTAEQKNEAVEIFGKGKRVNSIDYVGAWYYKAAELMRGTMTKAAFVATNSITQGEQVAALWGKLLDEYGVVIDFAWRTFRWDNESFDKAHVHCVIIGFHARADGGIVDAALPSDGRAVSMKPPQCVKVIFDENGNRHEVQNINPYLVDAPNTVIESRGSSICDVPKMTKGCYPSDGGNLILSQEERDVLLKKNPDLGDCVRRYVGAKDFINNNEVRYCLWLKDIAPSVYHSSSEVMRRLQAVREMRLASTAAPTRAMAEKPYLFFSTPPLDGNYLILPEVSSERRDYLPIGFMTPDVIAANTNLVVPGATLYHFGVLTSSVHMAWMRTVCGRLKSDYRYSAAIVYNNFPWPSRKVSESSEESKLGHEKIAAFLCGEPVARMTGHEFEGVRGGRADIKEKSGGLRSGSSDCSALSSTPGSIKSLAFSIFGVKGVRNVSEMADELEFKTAIEKTAQGILDARALYPDSSLADLYDPLTMPPELRKAHAANDAAVLKAYGWPADLTEPEIVSRLFERYAHLTQA